jgi:hypothetical protein
LRFLLFFFSFPACIKVIGGGGGIEEVEATAAVDRVARCVTGRCSVPEVASPRGVNNTSMGVFEEVSCIIVSNIPSLVGE